tara:strand:+ start:46 stop:324 length:279 start_codon:yes stop_codon:yes gene_type:complete
MWKLTKQYWKNMWKALWSKTTVDEKAIATIKEVKKRAKLTTQELQDVVKAFKEVGNQIGDIDNALRGEERKGRKTNMGKGAQNPINMGNSKK